MQLRDGRSRAPGLCPHTRHGRMLPVRLDEHHSTALGGRHMSTPEQRMAMAKKIVEFEAERDKKGHLVVHKLRPDDGGGRYEVAGINEKYNEEVCDHLVELIEAGEYAKAESLATEFIASSTDIAASWTKSAAIESYLRDSVFNRGQGGGAMILQMALGLQP